MEISYRQQNFPEKPYDARVEWLESTGSQWIDLGKVVSLSADFECKLVFTAEKANQCAFGESQEFSWNSTSSPNAQYGLGYDLYGSNVFVRLGYSGTASIGGQAKVGEAVVMAKHGNEIFANGKLIGRCDKIGEWVQQPETMFIFARHYAGLGPSYTAAYVRLFSLKFGDMFDLVPVRFANEAGAGEGGLYDRVSGKIFRNSGTGSFIIGPDAAKGGL